MSETETRKNNKIVITFLVFFGLTILFAGLNGGIQSDWGNIDVQEVSIRSIDGTRMTGKLYKPKDVNSSNPAPGVLAIHGYNNDRDVQRPHALELAKRGVVVFAVDVIYHGSSGEGGNFLPIEAYEWLSNLGFVDSEHTGVVGHSMGAGFARSVALAYPEIDVLGYQAFGPDRNIPYVTTFADNQTNLIQIWSTMEEFGGRTANITIDEWIEKGLEDIGTSIALTGVGSGVGEADTTYGDIASGNAQKYVLLEKTHPGQTHDIKATKAITAFFLATLFEISEAEAEEMVQSVTFVAADFCGAFSALFLMISIVPFALMLMKSKTFKEVKKPMPELNDRYVAKEWLWWIFATLNTVIGGAVYALFTNAPDEWTWALDGAKIEEISPIFVGNIANAFLAFYVVNAFINVAFVAGWFFGFGRRKGATGHDLGISYNERKFGINIKALLKTILLAFIVFIYMYTITISAGWLFDVEIRGPWSMFKIFTVTRAGYFWLYFWGILFFWLFNAGIWLFGLMRQKEYGPEWKTVLIWWLKINFAMLLGLLLLNAIGYFPMMLGSTGPVFNDYDFAPMMLLQLWAFYPIASVLFLIAIIFFRKTGKIYLGSIICAVIGTWLLVTGTIMF